MYKSTQMVPPSTQHSTGKSNIFFIFYHFKWSFKNYSLRLTFAAVAAAGAGVNLFIRRANNFEEEEEERDKVGAQRSVHK